MSRGPPVLLQGLPAALRARLPPPPGSPRWPQAPPLPCSRRAPGTARCWGGDGREPQPGPGPPGDVAAVGWSRQRGSTSPPARRAQHRTGLPNQAQRGPARPWARQASCPAVPTPRLARHGPCRSGGRAACVTCPGLCLPTRGGGGPLGPSEQPPPSPAWTGGGLVAAARSCFFPPKGSWRNFATVGRVAQAQTAVCCRFGAHMTQRKLGCKQTRCAEPLLCSHSLLVQRSDNSLCKMAAGHAFPGEPRRGGAGSWLRSARTSRMRCAEAFVIPAWCPFAGWLCGENKLVEFRQVQR